MTKRRISAPVRELLQAIDAVPFDVYDDKSIDTRHHADEITIRIRQLVEKYEESKCP